MREYKLKNIRISVFGNRKKMITYYKQLKL